MQPTYNVRELFKYLISQSDIKFFLIVIQSLHAYCFLCPSPRVSLNQAGLYAVLCRHTRFVTAFLKFQYASSRLRNINQSQVVFYLLDLALLCFSSCHFSREWVSLIYSEFQSLQNEFLDIERTNVAYCYSLDTHSTNIDECVQSVLFLCFLCE